MKKKFLHVNPRTYAYTALEIYNTPNRVGHLLNQNRIIMYMQPSRL